MARRFLSGRLERRNGAEPLRFRACFGSDFSCDSPDFRLYFRI